MGKTELTVQQRSVVEHDGDALLVSAAAGSGKTKVLVDRLLRKICDPVSPCNVDDFLIITYTKAAAAELRSKIAAEISRRLAEESGNRHLRNQLTRIYLAEISTVHAFCTGVLRNYAHLLDIPADFRVGDESECGDLRNRAVDRVLKDAYAAIDEHPEVSSFFNSLGYGRNDWKTTGLILAAYGKIQCHADPQKWTEACLSQLDCGGVDDITQTVWGSYILLDMQKFLQQQIARMEQARTLLTGSGNLEKYLPVFTENLQLLKQMLENLSWDRLHSANVDFGRLPAIRNCDDPALQNEVKNIRDTCKTHLAKKMLPFASDARTALEELKKTREPLRGLLYLVQQFEKAYAALKRQRKILDFSDLEHQTIRLLTDRYTAKPTETAKEISKRFAEIMVDEYQDSNQVQDTIFQAISRGGKNLFMVGDVKQSIYSFRLADPGIFLDKYRTYTQQESQLATEPRKILLSTNFRSRKAVLDAVNHVFYTVMSEDVGDLQYGEEEALRTIRQFPELHEPAVELHCIDIPRDTEDLMIGSKVEQEAKFIAERIRELIDGEHYVTDGEGLRRIRPEDIVILMRSVQSNAPVYLRALAQQGITGSCERSGNIFQTTEVSCLLAWLQIIDNPHQDIPLVAAMASPLGGFTADELAMMRAGHKRMDLYDALTAYAVRNEKHLRFLDALADLRQAARMMTLTELFDHLCDTTDAFSVFGSMEDGTVRTDHLQSLRDLCCNANAVGADDLSSFLRYVEMWKETGVKIESRNTAASGVTIMSIHKSKGLEFPVVFLCDLSRRFNLDDFKSSVFTDQKLYLAADVVDKDLLVRYPSPAKQAIALKKKRDMLSEELRILYVAMTRAQDRLIMTYCAANVENHIQDAAIQATFPVQSCVAETVSSPGQWVLLAAAIRPEARHIFGGSRVTADLPGEKWLVRFHESCCISAQACQTGKYGDRDQNEHVATALPQKYAFSGAISVPAKLTATQIKGRVLDEESSANAGNSIVRAKSRVYVKPFTIYPAGLTAAQKGTAMHLFMQYCDYQKCMTADGVEEEKKRLLQQNFLLKEQLEAVDTDKILRFFTSELGAMVTSGDVRREFKFSVLVDAGIYYPQAAEEEIMLQGVVDCFFIRNGQITVLDYKTDQVAPGDEPAHSDCYRQQLNAYKIALEKIFEMPVTRCILYYFATGVACDV